MSLRYVVDGYNLIHHPLFSRAHHTTDNPAQALLQCIGAYHLTGSAKNPLVLVFDGYPPRSYQECVSAQVVFSLDESADEYIKRLIRSASTPRTLMVVSDDREIASCARAHRANSVSVDEFFAPLQKAKHAGARARQQEENDYTLGYAQIQKINQELKDKWLK